MTKLKLTSPNFQIRISSLFKYHRKYGNNKKVSNESKDLENYIDSLISFKNEVDEYVNLCFEKNKDFQKKENEEFRFLMKDISPENLPNYEEFYAVIGLNGN